MASPKAHLKRRLVFISVFIAVVYGGIIGVNRFFRVLLRLSSPAFVLRQTPTMWRQIRRGQGRGEVEPVPGGTLIRYRDFPWFDDVNYRLLAKGSLGAIVAIAGKQLPRVDISDFGSDWLDARVEHK